MQIQLAGQS